MPRPIGRRGFLRGVVAVAAAASGVGLFRWRYARARERHVLRLGAWVSASQDARALGRAYFTIQPEEANEEALVRLLSADLDVSALGMDDAELRRVSREQMRRDFEEGKTVLVRGWVLSRTELRLCGLAALLTPVVRESDPAQSFPG